MNFYTTLKERGFVEQSTAENLEEVLEENKYPFYVGFDPTADSLHLGHLIPVMSLIHGQRCGHQPIVLVGGATGMIGDPSGKSEERNLLSVEALEANVKAIENQLRGLMSFDGATGAKMVNNLDWIGKISYIEWLRDVGKHFTIATMIAKESVKKRMENVKSGLSYTEFSYQLLQAYDFYHLYKDHGCRLQCGGSDQWGNITAGTELIRRKDGGDVYGLTHPLLTTSRGEKFGKTAGNAVWLDRERTSSWDFYQYWVNTTDDDVIKLLKLFTFLPLDEIAALEKEKNESPHLRSAQKRLAYETTAFFHSKEDADQSVKAAEALFKGSLGELPAGVIKDVLGQGNAHRISASQFGGEVSLLKLGVESGLFKSVSEGRRKLKEGAFYVNDQKFEGEDTPVTSDHLLKEDIILLRMGKKKYGLIIVE